MKERPILFSGPMVRAILDGRKTVTRRIAQLRMDGESCPDGSGSCDYEADWSQGWGKCRSGDVLWVRETWQEIIPWDPEDSRYAYRADQCESWRDCWRPSIHMPRAASRISLEVLSVYAEPLQAITDDDIRAEGFDGDREQFAAGWDGINGTRCPWESNPWVWVIRFRRVS